MMAHARHVTCLLPFVLVACADADSTPAAKGSDSGPTTDAAASSDTDAVDSAPVVPAFVSDPPGAAYVDGMPTSSEGLVLVSSRFVEEPSGGETYQKWLGEIRNVGTKPRCFVQLKVSLKDGSGTEVAHFDTFADADPFVTSEDSTLSMPCLAPGARAAAWSNGFAPTAVGPSSIRSVEVQFKFLDGGEPKPDPIAPSFEMASSTPYAGGTAVSGTLRANGTINNVGIKVYPVIGGVLYDEMTDTNLDEIAKGATWAYQTSPTDTGFTEFLEFATYIRGPETSAFVWYPSSQRDERAALHKRRLHLAQ